MASWDVPESPEGLSIQPNPSAVSHRRVDLLANLSEAVVMQVKTFLPHPAKCSLAGAVILALTVLRVGGPNVSEANGKARGSQ